VALNGLLFDGTRFAMAATLATVATDTDGNLTGLPSSEAYGGFISKSTTPPQLAISRSGASFVLTWPTNAAGFTLQSTTNVVAPAVWITNSPSPVVVNGQNTVTNPISGPHMFYRLSQ